MDSLSLYLDLEEGKKADLAITAQAMIAFSELIKEAASFVDPWAEVRIDFVSGTEGSLSINSFLKFLGKEKSKKTAITVFSVVSLWLSGKALDFTWEKVSDHIWEGVAGEKGLTEKEKHEIEAIISAALKNKVGEKQSQRMYREINKDHHVKGVGLSHDKNSRPKFIVPRSAFARHAGLVNEKDVSIKRRVRTDTERVVLVSPILVEGKRRWKFRSKEGEFGAPIKDGHFLESVLSGQIPILMKRNVEMTLEIETIEDFENGVWVPKERSVLKIVGIPRQFQGEQTSLFDQGDGAREAKE